jgi:hypothetical protein
MSNPTKAKKPTAPTVVVTDPELATSGRSLGSHERTIAPIKDDTQAKRRVTAFEADHEWQGVALYGFSSSRESLFSQLRLAAGAPPLEKALADVDAFFADAIRVLYLCSHEPADWRSYRARPLEWQEVIEEWADTAIPQSLKGDAILLGMTILTESYVNQHETKKTGNTHGAGK